MGGWLPRIGWMCELNADDTVLGRRRQAEVVSRKARDTSWIVLDAIRLFLRITVLVGAVG
jgi:hypothetical protein